MWNGMRDEHRLVRSIYVAGLYLHSTSCTLLPFSKFCTCTRMRYLRSSFFCCQQPQTALSTIGILAEQKTKQNKKSLRKALGDEGDVFHPWNLLRLNLFSTATEIPKIILKEKGKDPSTCQTSDPTALPTTWCLVQPILVSCYFWLHLALPM